MWFTEGSQDKGVRGPEEELNEDMVFCEDEPQPDHLGGSGVGVQPQSWSHLRQVAEHFVSLQAIPRVVIENLSSDTTVMTDRTPKECAAWSCLADNIAARRWVHCLHEGKLGSRPYT